MSRLFYVLILSLFFPACATNYKVVRPDNKNYTAFTENEGIRLEYQSDVMMHQKNRRQVRKESRNDISVVAVGITNHSGKTVVVGNNTRFLSGTQPVYIYLPGESYKLLKQKWPYYLFYLGLTPVSGTLTIGGLYVTGPVGIVLAPFLTVYNSLRAGKANKRLKSELSVYSLINKEIKPEQSEYGLIVIRGKLTAPLRLEVE